ncbi:MAG TPA: DUF58 domain-containing protein [Polyangiaceae bacterium]
MNTELARLNHVLVPATSAERDRYRNSRTFRRLQRFGVPFTRLSREGRALLVMACISGLFSADLGRTQAHVLVFSTAALLVAALLFTPAYRLSDVTAHVAVARRVTVGDELAITVTLHNAGQKEQRAVRWESPFLPWDGSFRGPASLVVDLPAGGRTSSVIRACFVARGQHQLDPFRALALLPLRLSQGAPLCTPSARFMVVPRVARVLSVSTPKNRRHQPGGVARASRTGDATDLLGVRPYRPGDPVRDLHARSWARLGSPMVREYQEEYFTRIGIVLDTDSDAADSEHLEGALSLSAGIIACLCRGEALVDVLVTGEHVAKLALGRSLGALDQALDLLAVVRAQPGFASERILAQLAPHLERLSSVVFVALSWDDARAAFVAAIRARGVGCLVLIVGDEPARTASATTVPLSAIVQAEALSL